MKEIMTYNERVYAKTEEFLKPYTMSECNKILFAEMLKNALDKFEYHSDSFGGFVEAMAMAFYLPRPKLHSFVIETYYAIKHEIEEMIEEDEAAEND